MFSKIASPFGTEKDLSTAIDQLLSDIENGTVKMKLYKQMKMYNDETLNPILYKNTEKIMKSFY